MNLLINTDIFLYFITGQQKDPKRVRTNTCPGKFRKVLEICTRHSTSMTSNDTQSQSEHSILCSITDCFYCIVVEEIKMDMCIIYTTFSIFSNAG